MEELRQKFEQETKEGRYNTEGAEPEENNGSFNDAYVEWLEQQVSKLTIHDVSNCSHEWKTNSCDTMGFALTEYCENCDTQRDCC